MTNRRSRVNLLTIALVTQAVGACNSGAVTGPSPFSSSPRTIRAISINGPSTIAPGDAAQFTARADYANGTSADVTATATWTSSHSPVLTVASGGTATAVRPGEARIVASHEGVSHATNVLVLAAGTYRVSGTVVLEGQSAAGFVVNVVSGTGAGASASTGPSGRYDLYGLAGPVEIMIWTDGTPIMTCAANVTDHTVLHIDIVARGCRRDL